MNRKLWQETEGEQTDSVAYPTRNKKQTSIDFMSYINRIARRKLTFYISNEHAQGTKKFRSHSLGLVDFVARLVEFILHLPDRRVKVFGKIFL